MTALPWHAGLLATALSFTALTGCAQAPAIKPAAPDAGLPSPALIEGDRFESRTVRYRCSGGALLDVVYLNLQDGRSFASLHFDGRTTLMQNRPAASGARYIALDEQHSLRWHTKGAEGTLRFMEASDTAREQTLLTDCRALPAYR